MDSVYFNGKNCLLTTKELLLTWDTECNVISLITMVTKVYPQTDNQSKFIICEEQVMIHLTKKQLLLGCIQLKYRYLKHSPFHN
jgi:hypothetical protein